MESAGAQRQRALPAQAGNEAGRAQALALNIEGEIERTFGEAVPATLLGKIVELAALEVGAGRELSAVAARRTGCPRQRTRRRTEPPLSR